MTQNTTHRVYRSRRHCVRRFDWMAARSSSPRCRRRAGDVALVIAMLVLHVPDLPVLTEVSAL